MSRANRVRRTGKTNPTRRKREVVRGRLLRALAFEPHGRGWERRRSVRVTAVSGKAQRAAVLKRERRNARRVANAFTSIGAKYPNGRTWKRAR